MLSSLHPKAMLACLLMCVSLALGDTQDSPKPQVSKQASNIVGGIAIKVNNDPITLYEIQSLSAKQHISKDKAQEILIAQRLKDQEIKRLNIAIDDMRLEQEIESIAAQNNLSYQQFIQALYQQGISTESYKQKLKDQIQTRELMRNILLSSSTSSEETMRKYYDTHKSEFITATKVQAIRYSSKDPKLLERAIANTSLTLNGVEKTPETLTLSMLNPQIAQMFSQLQTGQFSPILDAGNGSYVAFLVQDKSGENAMSFEEAKNFIAQKLAQDHQEQILSEYFEKIKQKAHIEYVRK
ncbi:peptidyl-prolyl cis-trans isomerase [Helicobacter canis]|uniref:SurA domain-containing protein n=1 Tax=Helicobacter canis TaxID=29419 RepID=A0A377J4G9_9HELI|nr:peptidyl-prolyl cis-trans isomerase [Helicobacter canis]STO97219.1 SurA domain-containing protein [Helicobacter canis]